MNHYESLIQLHLTTVKSCRCYEEYWKTMKKLLFPFVEFNYSIEKTSSFRIYVDSQNLLYHFCINCFYDLVLSIPIEIIEHENLKGHMDCFRLKCMLLGDCCRICIKYLIENYSMMLFRTI